MPSSFSRTATDTLLGSDTAHLSTQPAHATDTLLGSDTADISTGPLGTALVYLAVESNLDVPGWTLALPQPLIFAPVDQAADVPGWFVWVDDPINEPMTVDIFNADDFLNNGYEFATPLVRLDLEEDDRHWDWQDVRNDTGSGSITLPMNDPEIGVFDTDDLLVAVFNMYGYAVFSMLLEDDDAVDISENNEIGEDLTINGRGAGVFMEFGIIDPTGGPYRSPIEEDRHYGWPDSSFDHAAWSPVEVVGTVQDVINVTSVVLAGGLNENTPYWNDNISATIDREWPTRTTPVLGPPGFGLTSNPGPPPGDMYVYEEFTITAAGDYAMKFMADDRLVAYVDGQQVATVTGINFFGVAEVAITLSAGVHSVAGVVTQQADVDGVSGLGTMKYAWVIYTEDSDLEHTLAAIAQSLFGTPPDTTPPTIVAQSSGAAVCLAYPSNGVPGQSITKTTRLVVEEAQNRGYFPFAISLAFDDTTFSDGRAVTVLPDVASKVGQTVLGFLGEQAQTYIDWDLDPVTLVLYIWEKDTQGVARPATFDVAADLGATGEASAVTANIVSVRRKRERRKVSRLLIKWTGGWAEGFGSDSTGVEAPLELGSAQSLDEVDRLVAGEIVKFNDPRTQIDVGIRPEQRADAPYIGWRKADFVHYRAVIEQVAQLTVAVNSDRPDDPDIVMTLRDIIPTPEERVARDLKSLL